MRCSILILFLVAASLFAQQSSVPEIRYRSVPDFLKLPPDLYFGKLREWQSIPRDTPLFSRVAIPLGQPTEPVPHNC
jgi:hypothetical protein